MNVCMVRFDTAVRLDTPVLDLPRPCEEGAGDDHGLAMGGGGGGRTGIVDAGARCVVVVRVDAAVAGRVIGVYCGRNMASSSTLASKTNSLRAPGRIFRNRPSRSQMQTPIPIANTLTPLTMIAIRIPTGNAGGVLGWTPFSGFLKIPRLFTDSKSKK